MKKKTGYISLKGVRQNNLKGFDIDIPLNKINVVTGPSGGGKSSLAYQTIYAEGQRRYVETFSPYTRQFMERMAKPNVDSIDSIPPAIAIEQINQVKNSRSTVGSITEINDYLKLFFTRFATAQCPNCNQIIKPESSDDVTNYLIKNFDNEKILINFPLLLHGTKNPKSCFEFLLSAGFLRIWAYNEIFRTDEPEKYNKKLLPTIIEVIGDRIKVNKKNIPRLRESIENAMLAGRGEVIIRTIPHNNYKKFTNNMKCGNCETKIPKATPQIFSFNSPLGACTECKGFGKTIGISIDKCIPNKELSLAQGAIKPFQSENYINCQRDLIRNAIEKNIDINQPFFKLNEKDKEWIFYGDHINEEEFLDQKNNSEDILYDLGRWYGIKGFFKWLEKKTYKMGIRVFISRYRTLTECNECRGSRIKKSSLNYFINENNLLDIWKMEITDLSLWLNQLNTKKFDKSVELIYNEISNRINYLKQVGLSYLTLSRESRTLSGGEMQRVELTTCLGAALVNTLFVLDEPSVGLHMKDVGKLLNIIKNLCDKGNTLLIVEHDESVIKIADNIIDIGPGRGESGGELIFNGKYKDFKKTTKSLTSDYLFDRKKIDIPKKRRPVNQIRKINIKNAYENNLKNINVEIPLGIICCITGVSGSGKSTLAHRILYENLQNELLELNIQKHTPNNNITNNITNEQKPGKCRLIEGAHYVKDLIMVDQKKLSRTPRSTPIVYMGAFDIIRILFSETLKSKQESLTPGYFSFNSGNGRCLKCMGNGYEKIDMQFLSDIYVICSDCNGKRYTEEALKIKLNGKNIYQILNLTASEAKQFFDKKNKPFDKISTGYYNTIHKTLDLLIDVGLGYLKLGQPLNGLSGGESQRLKLAKHLLKNTSKKNLSTSNQNNWQTNILIFDEPTTGLHFDDVKRLLKVMQKLVDNGDSVIIIEHNLEIIKCADHIIDLGPKGGKNGGYIMAEGTPEEISLVEESDTGRYLNNLLNKNDIEEKNIFSKNSSHLKTHDKTNLKNEVTIIGAREHNLKNIDIKIPHNKLVVMSGLSGSGKSTIAFDIIYSEGQRRFLDSMSVYARQFINQMEKPDIDYISGLPPTVAIEQRISRGGRKSTVATVTEIYSYLRLLYTKVGIQHCPKCNLEVVKKKFSYILKTFQDIVKKNNTKKVYLLAPLVKGRKGFHKEIKVWANKHSVENLLVNGKFIKTKDYKPLARYKIHDIDAVIETFDSNSIKTFGINQLENTIHQAIEWGDGVARVFSNNKIITLLNLDRNCPKCGDSFPQLEPKMFSFNAKLGMCRDCEGMGEVIKGSRGHINPFSLTDSDNDYLENDYSLPKEKNNNSSELEFITCKSCNGERISKIAQFVKINGIGIGSLCKLTVNEANQIISKFKFSGQEDTLSKDIISEVIERFIFLKKVGLSYLNLNRSALTLSGGESQRIRLASQLGSNLKNVLYILDEPSIGLHPKDNDSLLEILKNLRDKGNSLIIVEHDEDTIMQADHIIDIGPKAGKFGGEIVAVGNFKQIKKYNNSLTLKYLNERLLNKNKYQTRKSEYKSEDKFLEIKGAKANNLKSINIKIPIGKLSVLTGVSGAGKSSLLKKVIFQSVRAHSTRKDTRENAKKKKKYWNQVKNADLFEAVYLVDQSPIGKTNRSTPATYIKLFDLIRKIYADLPISRMRGYKPGRFSFNNKQGQCETCSGNGNIKVEMNFMPTIYTHCESCNGRRFNEATLQIHYKEKSIADVLEMTINEATNFFDKYPKIQRVCELITDTGTGYLQLGQPSPTISGGEAQRIKLVAELARSVNKNAKKLSMEKKLSKGNLYLIEEPSIGLHIADINNLVKLLHKLVDQGHTVILVEHHLDIIAQADFVMDIGPEAGNNGGEIVVSGTPLQICKNKKSHTAKFLKKLLNN